jgi:predicted metal-dependent hydrolase
MNLARPNLPRQGDLSQDRSMSVLRNLRFDIGDDVPRYWHGGRKSVTTLFDNLSVFFPAGERFFMQAVRAHQHHVTGEALKKEVRAFCGQEAVHGREHERYNEWLLRQGVPVDGLELHVMKVLRRVTARTPKRMQLAATCALEHFTAVMAQMILGDPRNLEGAHPTMAALWRWHAAEENEHKCLPYDVFKAVGGHYPIRVATMLGATAIFWARVVGHQAEMMQADGTVFSAEEWWAVLKFLFIEPGGMFQLWGMYFEYFRPGFHPMDIDSTALLDAWRAEYAKSPVYAHAAPAAAAE